MDPSVTTGTTQRRSPRISEVRWGVTEVEGIGRFKDAKLWPGGARGWDWNETGTRHDPGIQPDDVEELIEHGAVVVVLSRGMQQRLLTRPETLDRLRDAGVEVHVEETGDAVARYNDLARQHPVGALIHSTC